MRNFTITILAVLLYTTCNAQAQKEWSFGLKAGANYSTISNIPFDLASYKFGFHVGGVASLGINDRFSVVSELTFSRQGWEQAPIEVRETPGDLPVVFTIVEHYDYINIPVLADYNVVGGLSFQAGPQFGIFISDDFSIKDESRPVDVDSGLFNQDAIPKNTLEVGGVFGLRYLFQSGIFMDARYVVGLSNVFENSATNIANRNAQVSLGVLW